MNWLQDSNDKMFQIQEQSIYDLHEDQILDQLEAVSKKKFYQTLTTIQQTVSYQLKPGFEIETDTTVFKRNAFVVSGIVHDQLSQVVVKRLSILESLMIDANMLKPTYRAYILTALPPDKEIVFLESNMPLELHTKLFDKGCFETEFFERFPHTTCQYKSKKNLK